LVSASLRYEPYLREFYEAFLSSLLSSTMDLVSIDFSASSISFLSSSESLSSSSIIMLASLSFWAVADMVAFF